MISRGASQLLLNFWTVLGDSMVCKLHYYFGLGSGLYMLDRPSFNIKSARAARFGTLLRKKRVQFWAFLFINQNTSRGIINLNSLSYE